MRFQLHTLKRIAGFAICVTLTACGFTLGQTLEPSAPKVINVTPKSGDSGTLLHRITSASVGINFTNLLSRERILENYNLTLGSGVGLGDFDGDGFADLLLPAIDGPNRLFRNLGNWQFEDASASLPDKRAFRHSTGAALVDIDGDHDADIILNTLGEGTHLLINEGSGRFREAQGAFGFASGAGATGLAIGDVDGDGDLDIYIANYGAQAVLRSGGQAQVRQVGGRWEILGPYAHRLRYTSGGIEEVGEPDEFFLNNGSGTFQAASMTPQRFTDANGRPVPFFSEFGLGARMGDLNGDGAPDIYVCNDFKSPDRIWMNDGRGRFQLLGSTAVRRDSYASMGVDFSDIDRDEHTDIFVVEMLARDHAARMRQHSSMGLVMPVPGRHDAKAEVAQNTLFHNRGDTTFAEIAHFAGLEASDWSWQPVFLDVDLDGFEDVLITNGNMFDLQDRDTLKEIQALGRLSPAESRETIFRYPRLDTPDAAFRNQGDTTFLDVSTAWGFDAVGISQGIALADLDNDGDQDIVINRLDAPPLLYRNDSVAPRVAVRLKGRSPNTSGIGAKVTLIGGAVPRQSREIIAGGRYLSSDAPSVTFAAGSVTNKIALEVRWRSGRVSRFEDVTANTILEITEPDTEPKPPETPEHRATHFEEVSDRLGHTHHEEWFADYERQPLLMKQLSSLGPGVAIADLDNDGHEDIVMGSGKGGTIEAFRGGGDMTFSRIPFERDDRLPDDTAGFASWIAKDSRRVLLSTVAAYEAPNDNHSILNTIESTAGTATIHPTTSRLEEQVGSLGPIAVADYEGDGDLDVFIGGRVVPGSYPEPATSQLLVNEDGNLTRHSDADETQLRLGQISGAVWSDLDADGFPELILAREWDSITIHKNDRGRLMQWNPTVISEDESTTLENMKGLWNSVTAGDFDGDGRLDIVAGNWGLNSTYQASPETPEVLYFGNISGSGTVDLFEATHAPDRDAHVPRRSLAALAQAAPALAAAFPTHEAFGKATMPEILGALQATPSSVSVTTLESMVFLNRGDHFEAAPLPREAQFAPIFGLNITDFDGDGIEDLFTAQNFFAVRPELARLDGGRGLWLRGLGDGTFQSIAGQESGIIIDGEQRGSAVGDFDEDGRPDLVVSQNGGKTKVYRNALGRKGLRVRLAGPRGNPHGIGAIVRANSGPSREVHAGSGYWSQDGTVQIMFPEESAGSIEVVWPGGKITNHTITDRSTETVLRIDATE